MATQIDLGAVVPIGKGDWDIGTTYERANIVRHNSVAWICKVESSTGVEPTEDSSDWYLLVKDTSSVTSVNGQRGDVNLDIISPSQVDNKIDTEINNVKSEINSKIPSVMVGASDEISGKSGIVPAPQAGQSEFFLRGDGTWAVSAGLPLGHLFTWPFSTPPDGSIIVNGATYSRTLYADLWTYISSKSDWVKTESEWQSIASANGGYCPYYSDGDGSTTFRVPKFAPYQQIALSSANAGTHHEAGLPNLTGDSDAVGFSAKQLHPTGVFKSGDFEWDGGTILSGPASGDAGAHVTKFDASDGNPIYGKSTTVQPESNEWIVCVVAYGKATNVGNVDVANVMSAVGTVQSALTNYLPLTGGSIKGQLNFNFFGTDDLTGEILAVNDEYGKRFLVDTYEKGDAGAYLSLRKGSDPINPGGFELNVRNAEDSVTKSLAARTDGNLLWDGKQIVRSVNGVLADSNGNVTVSSISGNAATATRASIITGYYATMGRTVTLPSGGTWAYFRTSPNSYNYYEDMAAGTAAGGTSFSFGGGHGGILAVRIA